jgi:hypothetical protein
LMTGLYLWPILLLVLGKYIFFFSGSAYTTV